MSVDEAFVLLFLGEAVIILVSWLLGNNNTAGFLAHFLAHIIIMLPGLIVGFIAEELFAGNWLHPNMWPMLICTWLPGILLNIALAKEKIHLIKTTRENEKLTTAKTKLLLRLLQRRKEVEIHLQALEMHTISARATTELLILVAICIEDNSLLMNESATTAHFRKLAVSTIAEYADRKQLADIDCSLEKLESCKDIEAIEFALSNLPKR